MKSPPVSPMLATLVKEPFDRPGWVFEEKYDGVRILAYRRGKRAKLVSRGMKDSTDQFPEIAAALERLPGADFVLDGEVVAFDRDDVSRFQLLQRRAVGEPVRLVYAVFDCLEREGARLVDRPLPERRAALEAVVPAKSPVLLRARRVPGSGVAAYEAACQKGWEGILAKDESAPYEPGRRSKSWLKVKCRKQSEFVVAGFTPPAGARTEFGALLVGLYDGDALRFTGKIGAGFSRATLADLGARMRALETRRAPFAAPGLKDVTWVRPMLVAQVAYSEWTRDGKLRHPVFLGLRTDKKPRECTWADREP